MVVGLIVASAITGAYTILRGMYIWISGSLIPLLPQRIRHLTRKHLR
jgi:hypothetical protein